MRILALDTSTSACSVAVWDDDAVRADQFVQMARGQSEHLVPMIQAVLATCQMKMVDMDMIAVSTGPGAFTGVRIGLATASGLALASGLPVRGISTLETVAQGVPAQERAGRGVLALVDSKREDIFVQLFDRQLRAVSEPQALVPARIASYCQKHIAALPSLAMAGDAAKRMSEGRFAGTGIDAVMSSSLHPQAAVIATVAADRGLPASGEPTPSPVYLRPPEVKIRADGGRLRP